MTSLTLFINSKPEFAAIFTHYLNLLVLAHFQVWQIFPVSLTLCNSDNPVLKLFNKIPKLRRRCIHTVSE